MAAPAHPSLLVGAGVAALVAWRVYARVRRVIGRQQLKPVRPWISVVLFPLLVALLLLASFEQPMRGLALLAGVAGGMALGLYGLHLTKFEATPAGLYYTPNAHIGIALSLLFVGRLAWRAVQLYTLGLPAENSSADFASSPLTMLIFGTLAGYYTSYAIGLLRWRAKVQASPATAAEPMPGPLP